MRYARLTATLALLVLISGILVITNRSAKSESINLASSPQPVSLGKWGSASKGLHEYQVLLAKQAAEAEAAKQAAIAQAAAQAERDRNAVAARASRSATHTRRVVQGSNNGDFASCVRQHESTNNYATNTGNGYHGAYQMTNSHWGGYGGYASADQAPPEVQDAKFQSDVAQGSKYMHQQYPTTSRACGM